MARHSVTVLLALSAAVVPRCGSVPARYERKETLGHQEPPPVPPFMTEQPLNVTILNDSVLDLFEGDIVLTEEQRLSRKGNLARLWPNGVVPFVITSSSSADSGVILAAISHWQAATCLEFVQQPESFSGAPHVRFVKDSGCWSRVGMMNWSSGQQISIGSGCAYLGIVAHEIGHAIGFWHEQSRTDRDNFVTVLWSNIVSGAENNFQIATSSSALGVPYDLSSLMHYGGFSFSSNGFPTIATKDIALSGQIGNRAGLTHRDKHLANLMYTCADDCSCPPICLNGGYLSSGCECACPPGTSGATCETITGTYYGATCGDQSISTAGTVTSPSYPSLYPPGQHCVWIITAPAGQRDRIVFNTFKIIYRHSSGICYWDWMTVHTDGDSIPDLVHCGSELQGQTITSVGNRLALELHSYAGGSYPSLQTGFSTSVTFV